ncbi:SDR family oxidoreductase [Brevundimonas diminuta]|uniref:SDR family oxidoreductase n=1 Tax=Brevundimonas diminuta TaxID=293 RepID=UPI0020982969|nr:SDR family oxidoreductase [Brevundimonas diminuta]MCO8017809.1 SDR family oxidoreductase [Brevundimonas diminuta]MCO8021329.1 SDR family oxidoreductase [Brevundimonas diminuta]
MPALSNKVVIITGASSGIGAAAARLFAREGAAVVVTARREAELSALVSAIEAEGGRAVAVQGDIRDEALAERLVQTAVERFGGLNIALNNAGAIGANEPTPEIALERWRDTLDVNLTAAFLGAKHQIPAMLARGGGSLIFTSTFVGHAIGMPGMAAYAAAKAGLVGLSRVIAAEYGAKGVRSNCLLPGGTDTEAGREFAHTPEIIAFVEGMHALKRMASPDEIARAALFLASDASSFMTGAVMLVDGGVSISKT